MVTTSISSSVGGRGRERERERGREGRRERMLRLLSKLVAMTQHNSERSHTGGEDKVISG